MDLSLTSAFRGEIHLEMVCLRVLLLVFAHVGISSIRAVSSSPYHLFAIDME